VTLHQNAKTCPASRVLMARRVLEEGWSLAAAAEAAGVSERRCSEWVRRYRHGDHELADRSSQPKRIPAKTAPEREDAILVLRELRFTAAQIAEVLGMAHSTVSAVLKRHGKGRLVRWDADEPQHRYERPRPGELVHIDIKKLGRVSGVGHRMTGSRAKAGRSRGAGWEFVHVCVDDCTRLAYVEGLDNERADSVIAFLQRAIAWLASQGVTVQRVMTDNGAGYRSLAHAAACRQLGLKHIFTAPYRPRTNGRIERFIRTLIDGWAYGGIDATNTRRHARLHGWLTYYNFTRPHRELGEQPPAHRLAEQNNAAGAYT
jgi:transposase InsO family protein